MKDNLYRPSNRFLWGTLAFQGGFVNVSAFKAFDNFVSHVTGNIGQFSISIANNSIEDILIWLTVPLAFLIGSITSGFTTARKKGRAHLPHYFPLVFLISFCYFLIVFFHHLNILKTQIGSHYEIIEIISIILLSYACGIQNALFTSASGAVVRTTHLTGLTTDLGIGIAKFFSKNEDRSEGKRNRLRLVLIFSFILGGISSSYFFDLYQLDSFIIPMIISALIGMRLLKTREKNDPDKNSGSL